MVVRETESNQSNFVKNPSTKGRSCVDLCSIGIVVHQEPKQSIFKVVPS